MAGSARRVQGSGFRVQEVVRGHCIMVTAVLLVAALAGAGEAAPRPGANGMNSVLPAPPIHSAAFAQTPAAKTPDQVRGLHWTFRDVEINALLARLKRFGVEVPVPVAGQVTVRLSAGVPSWRSILRTSAYQVEGQIDSNNLTVAGFDLHQLAARIVYHEGVLQLTSVRFNVPRPDGEQGTISGSAKLQVRPRGNLTANVSLERLSMSLLADVVPQAAGMIEGDAGGHLSIDVPVDRLRDLSAWRGEGHVSLEHVKALQFPPAEVVADLRLARGQAKLSNLTIELERLRLTGSGALALAAPFDYSAQLRLNAPDLAWLADLDPELRPPVDVGGQLTANVRVSGKIQLREFRAQGTLVGTGLSAGGLRVERLQVPYDVTAERIRLNPIQISFYGGQVGANATVPLNAKGTAQLGLQWRGVDVGALAAVLMNRPATRAGTTEHRPATRAGTTGRVADAGWQGVASGALQVQAPLEGLRNSGSWSGQGQLTLRNAAAYGVTLPQASLDLRVGEGQLNISQLSVRSSLAQLTGSARLKLQTPFQFAASLSIANVDLAQANRLPETVRPPQPVGGRAGVSADLHGTLQPMTFVARGAVASRRLQAGRAVLDRADFNYDVTDERVSLSQIVVDGYQGRLTGNVALPLPDTFVRENAVGNALRGVPGGAGRRRFADRGTPQRAFPTEARLTAHALMQAADVPDAHIALTWQRMNVARLLADLDVVEHLRGARAEGWSNGNVKASAKGELAQLDNWQAHGDVLLWALRLDQFVLRRAALTVGLDEGIFTLSKIEADEGSMRLNASAHIALSDAFDFGATVRLRRADLALLNRLPPRLRPPAVITGTANLSADVQGALDPPQLTRGDVDAALSGLSAFGWTGGSARLRSQVQDSSLVISELSARQGETTLQGSGRVNLAAPFDYEAKLALDNADLARANTLPDTLRPPMRLAGKFGMAIDARGTLDPVVVEGDGSLTARDLEADGAKIDRVALNFAADKERVSVSRLLIALYDGQINGSATVPLDERGAGRIAIEWKAIDVGRLATDLARPAVRLGGKIDGSIEAQIPAGKLARVEAWSIDAAFDAPQLTADTVAIGGLHGRLAYRDGTARYEVTGEAMLGKLQLAGVWQPTPPDGRPGLNEGRLQLTDARLATVGPLLRERGADDALSGTLSIDVKYRHDPATGQPLGSGDLTLNDVQYEGVGLLDEVHGQIRMLPGQMEVANVSGIVASGQLLASATLFLQPGRRSTFQVAINGAEAADLLSLVPRLASRVRGTIDAQLRGFFGVRRPVYVNGAAAIRQGRINGLEFSGLRAPIAGIIDPVSGTGQLHLHGTTAQVALGRVVGDFDVTLSGAGLDLNGKGKFSRVDLRTLLRRVASARRLGSGKISGKFTLAGRNVRTVRDLSGTVDADLTNAQAMSFPILQGVLPFLTGGISGSTTFNQGELRARLAGGVVRVDEFSVSSNAAQLYARGAVSLSGRLNLNVTVNTGQLNPSQRAVSTLAARIALFTAPPVALLLEASQFLSNQVINVEVTGTVRSPTVRIRPLPLLEQEVIQFFLLQAPGV
ncbi:MAG TPA: AsmA-like C-terminal region-containing protein [Pirellulales bacterium]|nr:AsmA-like C-terminal region-containing protein [Pirellulales bacterium]